MELKICHLYPDVLNLYGDRGNVICLEKRLQWRGIDVSVSSLPVGSGASLAGCDLVFVGGGQNFLAPALLEDLKKGRGAEIKAAIEDGVAFLAVSGGYQLLGNYYEDASGTKHQLAGALDIYSAAAPKRVTGNYKFVCSDEAGGSTVIGFEDRRSLTFLGGGVKALGKLESGFGNNGSDGTEGAHFKNVFCTFSHGPVLPKNPEFADYILLTALKRKYGSAELSPLDDSAELSAHRAMSAKL